ncbi:MAG TPA: hypothetical protein VHP33_33105 [Polyangiaceae bacterium]|nr:hypothetical protein [Polyangiaceae bacterium]
MNLDISHHLLKGDICAIAEQIRALKRELGTRWTRPMGDSQRALARFKLRATELCALRAFSRGKLHVNKSPHGAPCVCDPLAYHRRIVERLGPSYARVLEQSA